MDLNPLNALMALSIDPLYAFLVAVAVDDVFGIVLAIKTKQFDAHRLPSFLRTQFGTVQFLVVATAALAAYYAGGDVKTAATAVVVAGGGAMFIATLKDIYLKGKAILASK